MVEAEGFTTPELREVEVKILEAQEKVLALESELCVALRVLASSHAARMRATAAAIAKLDVTVALTEVAVERISTEVNEPAIDRTIEILRRPSRSFGQLAHTAPRQGGAPRTHQFAGHLRYDTFPDVEPKATRCVHG